MATSDGRGSAPDDTRENPTADETDPGSGRPGQDASRPPPRRATGSIPVQAGPRKNTTSIPIVDTDIVEEGPRRTGQIPVQSANLPPQRPVSKSGAIPRRPSQTAIPIQGAPPDTTATELPPERPLVKSGAIPRRPSQTAVPVASGPPDTTATEIPPERPVSKSGAIPRRASQTAVPIARRATSDAIAAQPGKKPGLLDVETSPKLPAMTTGGSLPAADPKHLSTDIAPAVDERTDPTTARPREESGDVTATAVQPALAPAQLSAKPTPRTRSVADVPWEEVKDEPTTIGVVPGSRPPSASDIEDTATKPLPRADKLLDLTDPDDDDAVPTTMLPRPPPEALAAPPLPKERGSELSDKPARRRAGTYSLMRAQDAGDQAKPKGSMPLSELSRVIRLEAVKNATHGKHGFQVAIGLIMLVLGGGGFLAFMLGHHDRPPLETLQVQYPYGFSGGQLPNGRAAPPVSQVLFDYKATVDCGDDLCVRYVAHSADNSFQIVMDLRKDGPEWKLVSGGGPPPGQGLNR